MMWQRDHKWETSKWSSELWWEKDFSTAEQSVVKPDSQGGASTDCETSLLPLLSNIQVTIREASAALEHRKCKLS